MTDDDALPPWTVLVVDPDDRVQAETRAALSGFIFDGRGLDLLTARSAAEAQDLLARHRAIVVVVTELMLETPQAGLDLIAHVRGDPSNHRVRIVVRTGHPEIVPERTLMASHDIDDYRLKSGTGAGQVWTLLTGALRTYAGIVAQATKRAGLARFLVATAGLVRLRTPEQFYGCVLPWLATLPGVGRDALLITFEEPPAAAQPVVRAGTGRFSGRSGADVPPDVEARVAAALEALNAASDSDTVLEPDHCVLRLRSHGDITGVILVEGRFASTAFEWQFLEIFRNKAEIAFENIRLLEELNAAQKASVLALATLAEYKDYGSTGHLPRIERLTTETARELLHRDAFPGMVDDTFVATIGLASMLHDVGMICVPDEILTIPGELVEEDLNLIYRHAEVGHRVLLEAARPLRGRSFLSMGAAIARGHHERYDGSGYPDGLRGDQIPLAARITAVADVFDALISDRHYRKAWPIDEAILWMGERAGSDFDPVVVEAFIGIVTALRDREPGLFPIAAAPLPVVQDAGRRGLSGLFGRLVGGRG